MMGARTSFFSFPVLAALTVMLAGFAATMISAASAKVFDPQTFTLENGMQVVVIPNHRAPVVTHMVWYKVGAADEAPGKSGIAHFFEHLMFKGTSSVPAGEFSKIVARNGGNENAFTSHDYTAYFQSVAKDRLELVMELEADRMTNLTITDAQVLPERDVVLEERRSRTDNDPSALLGESMNATLYQNHPYGVPIIGWAHEVGALTSEQAYDFYRRHYAPNNAILVVTGDITAAELKPLAEKYYGVLPRGDVAPRIRAQEPPKKSARRVVHKSPRVKQSAWNRSFLTPGYARAEGNEAYALIYLSEILGGGTTSRLYRSLVVDQKIATSAGTYYNADSLDEGQFALYALPRPGVSMDKIEAAMEEEMERLITDGVGAEEFSRARNRLNAAAIYARDSLFNPGRILGTALATGRSVEDVEAWPERVAAVTPEDIIAAARKYLRNDVAVTGLLLPQEKAAAGEDGS